MLHYSPGPNPMSFAAPPTGWFKTDAEQIMRVRQGMQSERSSKSAGGYRG